MYLKENRVQCSFCGCVQSDKNPFIPGNQANICKNCAYAAYKLFYGEFGEEATETKRENFDDVDFFEVIRK